MVREAAVDGSEEVVIVMPLECRTTTQGNRNIVSRVLRRGSLAHHLGVNCEKHEIAIAPLQLPNDGKVTSSSKPL